MYDGRSRAQINNGKALWESWQMFRDKALRTVGVDRLAVEASLDELYGEAVRCHQSGGGAVSWKNKGACGGGWSNVW